MTVPGKKEKKMKDSGNTGDKVDNGKTIIKELYLLLIYLTGWEEKKKNNPAQTVFRAWKEYRFEIMNELEKQRLIYQIPGGKSLFLTEEGKKKAEQLKDKYLTGLSSF